MSASTPVTSDQPGPTESTRVPMSPGDEAPAGTPGTGMDVCPLCGGRGRLNGATCANCDGTGHVNVGIGGA
ncbi:MAG TPA: hypothetical protein VMU47_25005 [Caldimonas sp.]|nr:hypothetical protein [Caldimonas sp.]